MDMDIDLVFPNPDQPRKAFDEGSLEELAASIKEYGVLEPLVVTPRGNRFMIIAGERRYRASLLAGIAEVPVVIKEADDALVEELALLENVQRQDLTIMEEARGYKALLDKGYSLEALAAKLGKKPRIINKRVNLLNLEAEFQKLTVSGELNASEAYELSRVPAHRQAEVCKRILSGELRSRSNNKVRDFVTGLLKLEAQGPLMAFELASPEERESLSGLESAVKSVERFLNIVTDPKRLASLKKAVFHTSVTPERLDLIIVNLIKVRRAVVEGAGMKSAMGE